jgi:hypothetical protein
MRLKVTWLLLSMLASAVAAAPARTDPGVEPDPTTPLVAHHPMLRSSLERIASGSRLWREALRALEGSGRRAILLTPDQVKVRDRHGSPPKPFDPELLAEVAPVIVSGSRVPLVLVVVNIPLLRQLYHSRQFALPTDVYRDLDRIVVHEVYGHALPYLLAGDVSGRCPDAVPGQPAVEACAVQRENAVRSELRLGRRDDAGLNGLSLARRGRWQGGT